MDSVSDWIEIKAESEGERANVRNEAQVETRHAGTGQVFACEQRASSSMVTRVVIAGVTVEHRSKGWVVGVLVVRGSAPPKRLSDPVGSSDLLWCEKSDTPFSPGLGRGLGVNLSSLSKPRYRRAT